MADTVEKPKVLPEAVKKIEEQSATVLDKNKNLSDKQEALKQFFILGLKDFVAYKNGLHIEFPPSVNALPDNAKEEDKANHKIILDSLNQNIQKMYNASPKDLLHYLDDSKKDATVSFSDTIRTAHLDAVAKKASELPSSAVNNDSAKYGKKDITRTDILENPPASIATLLKNQDTSHLNDAQKKALDSIAKTFSVAATATSQQTSSSEAWGVAKDTTGGAADWVKDKTTQSWDWMKESSGNLFENLKNTARTIDNPFTLLAAVFGIYGAMFGMPKSKPMRFLFGLSMAQLGSKFILNKDLSQSIPEGLDWMKGFVTKGTGDTEKIANSIFNVHENDDVSKDEIMQADIYEHSSKNEDKALLVNSKDLSAAYAIGDLQMKGVLSSTKNSLVQSDDSAHKVSFFSEKDSIEKIYTKDTNAFKVLEKHGQTNDKMGKYMHNLFLGVFNENTTQVDAFIDYSKDTKHWTLTSDVKNEDFKVWKAWQYVKFMYEKKDAIISNPKISADAKIAAGSSLDINKATMVDMVAILQGKDKFGDIQKAFIDEENKIIKDPKRKIKGGFIEIK